MEHGPALAERRRHLRTPVGLPVQIHLTGRSGALTVELVDLAEGGVRFRSLGDEARVDQRVWFTFLIAERGTCTAEGRILRVHPGGEFIVVLDRSNDVF